MSEYAQVNATRLHFLDHPGGAPPLVLLPGLTANAHSFDGLIAAGLAPAYRAIAMDLRGRGLSQKPEHGYTMRHHAEDIIGLMDHLRLAQAIPVGHSFGGIMAYYLAAHYPSRIPSLVAIDASVLLISERTRQMIIASLDRLEHSFPSLTVYMDAMRQMPTLNGFWSDAMAAYYRGDVRIHPEGTVQALASPSAIAQTIDHQFETDWQGVMDAVRQPVLLLNALGGLGPSGTPALMSAEIARQTIASIADCTYQVVSGNHITMIFGDGAVEIVAAIKQFLSPS